MKNSTTLLKTFAELLITCMLISAMVLMINAVTPVFVQVQQTIASEKNEYNDTDLVKLDGAIVTGTEALSYVRKYQSSFAVEVTTALQTTVYPKDSLAVINDPSSASWIDPTGFFTVTIDRTVNGQVRALVMTQNGVEGTSFDPVQDVDDAKTLIANALGIRLTAETVWAELADQIKNGCSVSVKKVVVDAIGPSANTDMSWQELALLTRSRINELQQEKAELEKYKETNQYQKTEGTLSPGATIDLGFEPSVICVVTEEGAENYVTSTWHGGDSCTLSGSVLSNDSEFVVRYYAYR